MRVAQVFPYGGAGPVATASNQRQEADQWYAEFFLNVVNTADLVAGQLEQQANTDGETEAEDQRHNAGAGEWCAIAGSRYDCRVCYPDVVIAHRAGRAVLVEALQKYRINLAFSVNILRQLVVSELFPAELLLAASDIVQRLLCCHLYLAGQFVFVADAFNDIPHLVTQRGLGGLDF